jgi:lysozyme
MNISLDGIALVKQFEGCKLEAYDDGGGVQTIGYGHTDGVREGQACTQEQADCWLSGELAKIAQWLDKTLAIDVSQKQFDALCSFVYNVGEGAFLKSTLLRKLNAGDIAGAAAEFQKWDHDNGRVVAGLTKRRAAEARLFMQGAL